MKLMKNFGLDDDAEETTEVDDFADFDDNTEETEEGTEDEVDELAEGDESVESMDNEESDEVVDDVIEINCQINAKMISNLFDKIAELKNKIEGLGLDENSREYLKYDVTIQYYSDKLQDLQNKTNPGIDQSKVETAIQKISSAIEQLEGETGDNADGELQEIQTPEQVSAEAGLTDIENTEAETDGEETTEAETEETEEVTEDEENADDESEEAEEVEETDDIEEEFA